MHLSFLILDNFSIENNKLRHLIERQALYPLNKQSLSITMRRMKWNNLSLTMDCLRWQSSFDVVLTVFESPCMLNRIILFRNYSQLAVCTQHILITDVSVRGRSVQRIMCWDRILDSNYFLATSMILRRVNMYFRLSKLKRVIAYAAIVKFFFVVCEQLEHYLNYKRKLCDFSIDFSYTFYIRISILIYLVLARQLQNLFQTMP